MRAAPLVATLALVAAAGCGGPAAGSSPSASGTPRAAAPSPAVSAGTPSATAAPPGSLHVRGNRIVDASGRPWSPHGVDRPSLEWDCHGQPADGRGSGIPAADFAVMAHTWHADTVRIALNQDFWLGAAGMRVAAASACPDYVETVRGAVAAAEAQGLRVILDLHWSDEGDAMRPAAQHCSADLNSVTFWRDVATTFGADAQVLLELYNEPHDVSWAVWRDGGTVRCPTDGVTYRAAGMQELLDAVRGAGAPNVVIAGGLDWAYDLGGLDSVAPLHGDDVAYATHPYEAKSGDDPAAWDSAFGDAAARVPVIATEFGTTSCAADAYDTDVLAYFRDHGVGYTAWAWFAGGCSFPSLIGDAAGTCVAGGCAVQRDLAAHAG